MSRAELEAAFSAANGWRVLELSSGRFDTSDHYAKLARAPLMWRVLVQRE